MDGVSSAFLNGVNRLVESVDSAGKAAQDTTGGGNFADVFKDTFDLAADTETDSKVATLQLLSGDVDDLAGILIDTEKSKTALNLTIQIRNKVVDAYKEVINMQI